jgi:hypothetical protein
MRGRFVAYSFFDGVRRYVLKRICIILFSQQLDSMITSVQTHRTRHNVFGSAILGNKYSVVLQNDARHVAAMVHAHDPTRMQKGSALWAVPHRLALKWSLTQLFLVCGKLSFLPPNGGANDDGAHKPATSSTGPTGQRVRSRKVPSGFVGQISSHLPSDGVNLPFPHRPWRLVSRRRVSSLP